MLVTIRFLDQAKTVNMNCKCGVILEHIRKCANLDSSLMLDVCDKDGNVKLLRQHLSAYSNTCLSSSDTYFLVSATEEAKQYVYQLHCTFKPEETPIEVKPTKIDKKDVKKPMKPPPKKGK